MSVASQRVQAPAVLPQGAALRAWAQRIQQLLAPPGLRGRLIVLQLLLGVQVGTGLPVRPIHQRERLSVRLTRQQRGTCAGPTRVRVSPPPGKRRGPTFPPQARQEPGVLRNGMLLPVVFPHRLLQRWHGGGVAGLSLPERPGSLRRESHGCSCPPGRRAMGSQGRVRLPRAVGHCLLARQLRGAALGSRQVADPSSGNSCGRASRPRG